MSWRRPCWRLLFVGLLALIGVDAGFGVAEDAAERATREYNSAVRLQNLGSFDMAAEAWQKFLAQFPDDSRAGRAQHYLGVCYIQLQKFDQAASLFQEIITKKIKLEADLLEATHLYLGIAQYTMALAGKLELADQAADTFNGLITGFPQSKYVPDALFYRGECFYQRGKKQEAAQSYSQLVAAYPNHKFVPDGLYALGTVQQELGQAAEAGKSFDQFLAQFPKHALAAEVTMRRGDTLFAEGRFEEAAKRLAQAAASPGFALADYATIRYADALAQMTKYAEAAAIYASVLEKFGSSAHAARAALAGGKCYYLAGQRAEARQLLAHALKAEPAVAAEAAHWTAKSWLEEGKPLEALAVVEPALAQAAQSEFLTALLMDRAEALYAIAERRKESIARYAELAAQHAQDPLAPQAAYMAAYAALQERLHDEALKHAQAFLAAYASHELVPDVMHVAAESHLLAKRWPEAEALYGQLLEKYGNHPDADLWKVRRALSLQLQKKHAETVAALASVVSELRDAGLKAEAYYLVGGSQLELGQLDAAIASLEASLGSQPKWRLADETLLLLA